MPITFKPIERSFENLPESYQELARQYLIGKEFGSLEEALSQEHEGQSLDSHGFRVNELKLTPKNLPHEINMAVIGVGVSSSKDCQNRVSYVPVLIARYSK